MAERGMLMTAVTRGAKLAEKALAIPLATARSVRDEVVRASFAGVDRLEDLNQSALKVARDVLGRLDKASQDAIGGVEAAVAALSKRVGTEAAGAAAEAPAEQAEEASPRPRVAAPV